jgi:hypothetical protein
MKIFDFIHVGSPGPGCQQCTHFQNDPAVVEATYRGLTAMSSGFASVRDRDGFCDLHQIYLSARDSCARFVAGTAATAGTASAAGTAGIADL